VATKFQNFISVAQDRLIPNQTNPQLLKEMVPALFGTVDLTGQATRIEWATGSITLTGVTHPVFTFPAVPVDEIHVYMHIGVVSSVGGGAQSWDLLASYPGIADAFREVYSIDVGDENRNFFITGPSSNSRAQRNGRPYTVYPGGVLVVNRQNDGALNDVLTCNVLRQVLGGPHSAQIANNVITATEA